MADNAAGLRQLVVFRLGDDQFALDIGVVREIIRMQPIAPLPDAGTAVRGVINLRGRICTVMDLRPHLGVAAAEAGPESRIIVVDGGGEDAGIIVDGVTEVLRAPDAAVQAPQAGASDGPVAAIVNLEGRLIVLLDLPRTLAAATSAAA